MKPPTNVKVGLFDIKIVDWHPTEAAGTRRYGEFSSVEKVIRVDFSKGRVQGGETLLHEILHAVCWVWAIASSEDEDDIIGPLSLGLGTVIRDNPKVFDYIKWAICEKT